MHRTLICSSLIQRLTLAAAFAAAFFCLAFLRAYMSLGKWLHDSVNTGNGACSKLTAAVCNSSDSYKSMFMKPILYNKSRSVKSYNSRVRFLIFHYTARNFSSSLGVLTGPDVSAHYLIPDITDPSYLKAGYTQQEVFNLVDEQHRAWHAGASAWGNRTGLNDTRVLVRIGRQKEVLGPIRS